MLEQNVSRLILNLDDLFTVCSKFTGFIEEYLKYAVVLLKFKERSEEELKQDAVQIVCKVQDRILAILKSSSGKQELTYLWICNLLTSCCVILSKSSTSYTNILKGNDILSIILTKLSDSHITENEYSASLDYLLAVSLSAKGTEILFINKTLSKLCKLDLFQNLEALSNYKNSDRNPW